MAELPMPVPVDWVPVPNPGSDAAPALVPVASPPADQNPALVYLAGLRSGPGRATMHQVLDAIARAISPTHDIVSFPWARLRFQHTAAVRAQLAERYAPATANKMIAALKGTLKAAWRLGQMPADDYQRAADLPAVRGTTEPRGRSLSADELRRLARACANDLSALGKRDGAILAVLYGCGLRRAELVALDLADFDPEEGSLFIRAGKGHKARRVYLGAGGQSSLHAYLGVRGRQAGPLFQPTTGCRRLTPAAIYKALARRARQAGVASFSPHDLRRTFVGDLLEAGVDIATVQRMAGHANVTTTARYDRRGEKAKRRAADAIGIPTGD